METFNVIVFLWRLSFFVFIVAFLMGLVKRSWGMMVISAVASLPIAYYFFGAENAFKLVALVPFLAILLAILFKYKGKAAR